MAVPYIQSAQTQLKPGKIEKEGANEADAASRIAKPRQALEMQAKHMKLKNSRKPTIKRIAAAVLNETG